MKSTLDQLSAADKEALALLYDTKGYEVLKKIHKLEQFGLGQDALAEREDLGQIRFLNGRLYQSKATLALIRESYKQANKDEG